MESVADREFWDYWGNGLDATPLYYPAFLGRFAGRVGEAELAASRTRLLGGDLPGDRVS